MPETYLTKRVFEVARDIKAPTNDIVDFLNSAGFDVTRKQMHPVDERMFIAILHRFDRLRFEKYLTDRGITGDDLKRMITLLDEQSRVKPKPPASTPVFRGPLPKTPYKKKAAKVERPVVKRPVASEEPTNFKIIVKPRPPVVPTPPVNPFALLSSEPKEILTTPLTLELMQRLLALEYDQKIQILEFLRNNKS